jgi:hypothetical protein
VVEIARWFEVSRQAGHRWLRWHEDQGLAGLADRAHRPPGGANQMDPVVEVWVLDARRRHPDWRPRRLVYSYAVLRAVSLVVSLRVPEPSC